MSIFLLAGALVACDSGKSSEAADDASVLPDSAATEDTSGTAKALEKPEGESASAALKPSRPSATSPGNATLNTRPVLDIAGLLGADDLKGLTDAKIESEKLAGKPASHRYGGTRLYPAGSELYGVGLQVWKQADDAAAVAFVDKMRAQYLSVDELPDGAPVDKSRGFSSNRAGIQSQVFASENAGGYVVAISCGEKFCKKGPADLLGLARTVDKRLNSLSDGAEEAGKEMDKDKAENLPTKGDK